MKETFGLIPRLPDFLQNVLIGLFDFKESISDNEICFKKILKNTMTIAVKIILCIHMQLLIFKLIAQKMV